MSTRYKTHGKIEFGLVEAATGQAQSLEQILDSVVDDGLPDASITPRRGKTGAQSWGLENKLSDIPSAFDYIPASLHSAIQARTSTDDVSSYLQAAIDADNAVFIPDGRHLIKSPIRLRSNSRVHGGGAGCHVYNDKSNASTVQQSCFLLGDHNPYAFTAANPSDEIYTNYTLNAITAGDRTVTCTTTGDAANFTVGELVFIRTNETEVVTGNDVPYYAQPTKIQDISGGDITLYDPVLENLTNPRIAKIGGNDTNFDLPWYMAENVVIENIAVSGWAIGQRWSCYRSVIRNVFCHDVTHLLSGNAISYSLIDGIFGNFSGRGVELKNGGFMSIVRNVIGSRSAANPSSASPIVEVGEQAYGMLLDGVKIFVGEDLTENVRILQLGAPYAKCINSSFYRLSASPSNDQFIITSNDFSDITELGPKGCAIVNCDFEQAGAAIARIGRIGDATKSAHPSDPLISNVRTYGPITTEAIHIYAARRAMINGLRGPTTVIGSDSTGRPWLQDGSWRSVGIPTTGTYQRLDRIWTTTPSASNTPGWVCVTAGSFGTLTSVTGGITSGTTSLAVNALDVMRVGDYITIAGVTGTKRVIAISGTTVTIDTSADATVSGAAVAYSAPTLKAMANLGS